VRVNELLFSSLSGPLLLGQKFKNFLPLAGKGSLFSPSYFSHSARPTGGEADAHRQGVSKRPMECLFFLFRPSFPCSSPELTPPIPFSWDGSGLRCTLPYPKLRFLSSSPFRFSSVSVELTQLLFSFGEPAVHFFPPRLFPLRRETYLDPITPCTRSIFFLPFSGLFGPRCPPPFSKRSRDSTFWAVVVILFGGVPARRP